MARASVAEVATAEQGWAGVDRSADHRAWAARPHGQPVRAFRHGELAAAGTAAGHGGEYGLVHMAIAPEVPAGDAVLAVLATLQAPDGRTRVCLPGPHPAVRPLFAAGCAMRTPICSWRPARGCSTRTGRCPAPAVPDVRGDPGHPGPACQ